MRTGRGFTITRPSVDVNDAGSPRLNRRRAAALAASVIDDAAVALGTMVAVDALGVSAKALLRVSPTLGCCSLTRAAPGDGLSSGVDGSA